MMAEVSKPESPTKTTQTYTQPIRIGVRRGATIPRGRFENERIELWTEAGLAGGVTLQEGLRDLQAALDQLLAEAKSRIQFAGMLPEAAEEQLTPQTLDQLAWKPYREGSREGWIFTDKAPKPLVERLEKEETPLVISGMQYRFSGPEEQPRLFISRTPIKESC